MPLFSPAFEQLTTFSLEQRPMRYWSYKEIRKYRQRATPAKPVPVGTYPIKRNEVIQAIIKTAEDDAPNPKIFPAVKGNWYQVQMHELFQRVILYFGKTKNERTDYLAGFLNGDSPAPTKIALINLLRIIKPDNLDEILRDDKVFPFIMTNQEHVGVNGKRPATYWVGFFLSLNTLLKFGYNIKINKNNEFVIKSNGDIKSKQDGVTIYYRNINIK